MKLIKFVIVLAFAAAIFGTIGFFVWQLYVQPEQVERRQEKIEASAPPATPPPDYSLPALASALALEKEGKLLEARDALQNFIIQYPQSTKLADAKAAVGGINTQFVFTSAPGPDKIDYTVVPGDSLVKVAGKTKSNAELILRSNNLASIDLSVGQPLRIPQLDISLVLDRQAKTLTILNKGQLFKEYPLLALDLPPGARGKDPIQTQIKDKIAIKGSGRVAFGTRDYAGSERWLMLGLTNAVIRGKADENAPMPPGIIVSQEDIEEIFPLVAQRTSVTIQ
jgi:LysM repeat protein